MKDLSLYMLDLTQNSIRAGASRMIIEINSQPEEDMLSFSLEDNGSGMDEATVERVQNPFYTTRTTRKVGLGIPLFKEGAEQAGGSFSLWSKLGMGTIIKGSYQESHLDRPPLGDLAGSILALVMANPELDFTVTLRRGEESFIFDTVQIRQELDGVPLDIPEVQVWMKEYIYEGVNALFGGNIL